MLKDQRALLSAFNEHGVKYLVVGGQAVIAYGVPRLTKDLDVLIRADAANSEAVYRALASFGAPLSSMSAADFRDSPETVFQFGVEPNRVDILQSIPGVEFDEHGRRGLILRSMTLLWRTFDREQLIQNKLACGRLQDLADAEQLQKMKGIR